MFSVILDENYVSMSKLWYSLSVAMSSMYLLSLKNNILDNFPLFLLIGKRLVKIRNLTLKCMFHVLWRYLAMHGFSFFLLCICFVAIFDRSGRYVITGSDDRLVKIWSMETAFCLASCRGHEVSSYHPWVSHIWNCVCLCMSLFCCYNLFDTDLLFVHVEIAQRVTSLIWQ